MKFYRALAEHVIISRQASMLFLPCRDHVSKRVLITLQIFDPLLERVTPLILRATTAGLIARSAALFSEGTSGLLTKLL
jgi:hypothetical protein